MTKNKFNFLANGLWNKKIYGQGISKMKKKINWTPGTFQHVSEHMYAEYLHCTMIIVRERVLKHDIMTLHAKCRQFANQFDTKSQNSDFFRKSGPEWEHCICPIGIGQE